MKKEYTKPEVKIVSFITENIITESSITPAGIQSSFDTLSRSDA